MSPTFDPNNTIDTKKDEGFNMFMQALGFEWIEESPIRKYWRHKTLSILVSSKATPEQIVEYYTRAVEQKAAKVWRNSMLDALGLSVNYENESNLKIIVDDMS